VTSLNEGNQSKSKAIISNSIAISTILGIILSCLQYLWAPYVVQLLSGSAKQSIPYGIKYARIRSLSSAFSLLIIIGQALFLASKDSITPLKSTIIGAVVNLVVDVVLVMILKTGVVGAAFATCLSQVISALYLLYIAVMKSMKLTRNIDCDNRVDNDTYVDIDIDADAGRDCLNRATTIETIRDNNNTSDTNRRDVCSDRRQVESRPFWLAILSIMKSYFVLPSYTELWSYLHFSSSLFIILLIKTFLWTFTTYASSVSGIVALAAHQVMI
jgi:Na+-driven multidrug efflux pump